jgi:hypothetical protein
MLGLSEEFVDESCPKDLEPYDTAHNMWRKEQDEIAWTYGIYVKSALESVLGTAFGKGKVTYLEQSIMAEMSKYEGLTQEEIDEIEIRKMITNDMAWSSQQKQSGLKDAQV